MSQNLKKAEFVEGIGQIHYISNSFDKELEAFKENGLKLITAKQFAQARILTGINSIFSQNVGYVKEGSLYIPKKFAGEATRIALRNSQVPRIASEAVSYHRNGKEIPFGIDNAMEILEKAKKGNKNYVIIEDVSSIPKKEYGNHPLTLMFFGNLAKKYGDFLDSNGKSSSDIYLNSKDYINSQETPFINQMWLGSVPGNSIIYGNYSCLNYYDRAFGVPITDKGNVQKNMLNSRELAKSIVNDYINKLTYNEKITVKGIEQTINEFNKVK